MLRGPIVPNCDIALTPTPTDGIFQTRNMVLKDIEQASRVTRAKSDKLLEEGAEHQRSLSGDRVHTNHGVFGFENRRDELGL
jgi:hypothetical protein